MKKPLLSALTLSLAVAAAQAAAPIYEWNYLIDSPLQQDASSHIVVCPDGSFVTHNHFGSKTADDAISFNGATVATGAPTNSTSENRNLLVIKHNADGTKAWALSSMLGEFDSANGAVQVGADGSVYLLLKGRVNDYAPYEVPTLVDGTGAEVALYDFNHSARVYNQVLVKVSAEGAIRWAKSIAQDQLPLPAATSGNSSKLTSDGVTPYAMALDADGNIFIAGNYRSNMVVTGDKNATYILSPRNIASYNGDTQQAAGGTYLIKLDNNGNYLTHARFSGENTRDQIAAMTIADGTLYFVGNASGAEGQKVVLDGKEATFTNTLDNILSGAVSTADLSAKYLSIIAATPNKSKKHTTQIKALEMVGGNLYVAGLMTGGFAGASGTELCASTGTMLEGYILNIDTATGAAAKGYCNSLSIGGYTGLFGYKDKLYAYGYVMKEGLFLDEFDADFANPVHTGLATCAGVPTSYGAAFDSKNGRAVVLARANNVFKFGEFSSAKPTGWGGIAIAYKFEGSDAESVASDATTAFKAEGGKGIIRVSGAEGTTVTVSALNGTVLNNATLTGAALNIPAEPGLYLVNDTKVLVK